MSTNNVNIVNTNNWYQKMNTNGTQNITNMTITGTNPTTQMLLINSADDVHYVYSGCQLSKTNGFTLSFQLNIAGTNMNSICAYFGVTDPTTNFDANGGVANQSGAVELRIAPATPIFQLYTNYGSNTVAATSSTSVSTNTWHTVTITYTPNSVGTWVVNYDGTNVISYNDSSYTTFANNGSTYWGLYGATAQNVQAYIRAVDLSVKQSLPLAALKNTYSFYPEECFINKLSTYSQNNVAAAFGLRLLQSNYLGPIINVRRGADNATLDFYADSKGNLGTSLYGNGQSLLSWLGGSIGYVTRWYDQTDNGRDVIQSTSGSQPKIGTPVLDKLSSSGKSAARGAYALYRINSTYTGSTIKLRRSSDNAVSDFYADVYGNLTDATGTTFISWIGSSTAYVDTWYDQSGSGNHATQTTTANQPVYNGTLKLIDSLNSDSLFLNIPSGTVPTGTLNAPYSFVVKHGAINNNTTGAFISAGIWNDNQSNILRCDSFAEVGYRNYWYNNDFVFGANSRPSGTTVTVTYNGTIHSGFVANIDKIDTLQNTNSNHTGSTTAAGQQYLFRASGGEYLNGQMYSVFIFGAALSDADRIACQSNPLEINIKYDGSQFLVKGTTNYPLLNASKNYTYIFNGRIDGNNIDQAIIDNGTIENNQRSALYCRNNYYGLAGHFNDNLNIVPYSPFVNRKIVMMLNNNLSSGNITINDNGSIYTGTSTSPSSLNFTNNHFTIGTDLGGTFASVNGIINEIIIFRNTLTTKESMLYFTPNAITRKICRSTPRVQIKDVVKDNEFIPFGAVVALDTQMLMNQSYNSYVTSWNGFTGNNNPLLNAPTYNSDVIYNIPHYVSLINGSKLSSDTSGQYLSVGSKTFNVNTNGGFTAIWYGAFTGTAQSAERIFDFGNGQASDNITAFRDGTSTDIAFYMLNGSTEYYVNSPSGVITQNEWAVWTFRYTASSRLMEIIKNGITLATGTAGAAITDKTLSTNWIGRSQWSTDYFSNINTVGLYAYDKYLTDTQVATVSNHLMYNTSSNFSSVLPDYNNKVVRYGSTLSQGYFTGQSIRFNGHVDSYIEIQDIPNWPLTFSLWFYNTVATSTTPLSLGSTYSHWGIQVDLGENGATVNPYYSTTGNTYTAMTTSTSNLNAWNHIVFTVSPTTIAYYLNGTLIQSVAAVIYNTNKLLLGKSGDNYRPLNGYLYDVRVFDYVLRADEITDMYNYSGPERTLVNYNTPKNYLVNLNNWYSIMNINKSGSFTITSGLYESEIDVYYKLTSNTVANSSNTIFNSTKIQDYNSFTLAFALYFDTATDHGAYFYCGATSSTTVPTGTAGTAANSSYYVYFQITGTRGVYLYNDQGQQLAYSPVSTIVLTSSRYIPITITYNRSVTNTWTINVAGSDIIKYDNKDNENWVTNIAGDFWGIGARTTTSAMNCYIRRVELAYTPYINSTNTIINAQNSTKFPPGAMTADSTTFTGNSILNGVYTATASGGYAGGANSYSAFDNSTSTYWGEITGYNSVGNYTGAITTSVTNLVTNTATSYAGEWIQIQTPNPISLNSFSLMGRQDQSLFTWRSPNTFYIAGSNNGSTWELVHSTSGAQFTSAIQYFTCNAGNINKYTYFRLITTKIGNNGTIDDPGSSGGVYGTINITTWDLYTQMNTVNSGLVRLPPYSMTSNSTTFAGNSVYDGTYTLTSSNTSFGSFGGDMFNAFDDIYGILENTWGPGGYYNSSTGTYTGSVSTTVSGVTQSGEWLQIQIPNPIVLYSFSLRFFWTSDAFWAKSFLIAASNDASTWTNIYDTTNGGISAYSTEYTYVITGAPVPYRYFRLIVRNTSGSTTCAFWFLDQWKLFTNTSNFNLMKFPQAPLTADTPPTFLTVNTNNWYNVMSYYTSVGSFNPVLSGSDPYKQLQLSDGTQSIATQIAVTNQPVMNYKSFTFTFQLYCENSNSGDWLRLVFGGGGGYYVEFAFEIYYYQGIRLNTSDVGAAVSSATNWYNSTWNNIRIEYLRGPTNTWTMYFNETQIIQYSDPNWYKTPGGEWGFNLFNGAFTFNSSIRCLEMTIEPQTQPGNSVVSGSYTTTASTVYINRLDTSSYNAFGNSGYIWHSTETYTNGAYTGAVTTTVSGTSYSGEWLQLQTPKPVSLTSFGIYPRQDDSLYTLRSPKNFVIAGSKDGSTWTLLHTATGMNDWSAAEKYFVCNGGAVVADKYSYFRLITMALNGGANSDSNSVNIQNLNLYTPITLNNSITPATPKGLLDGLTWKYYDGYSSDSMTYYTTNTYTNIGRCVDVTDINTVTNGYMPINGGNTYSIEIFGYFRATVSGTYTFSLASDDGSFLWIGSNALIGYTTSNANINNGTTQTTTCTITLLAGTYYPMRIHFTENGGDDYLQFSFTPPNGIQTSNGQGYFFSGTGLDSAFPQESAKIIKDLTNTNTDGVYYILVNGISTPTPCLMNDCYDGGGWMMLMKGTRGTTFNYSSQFWTTKNTLNAGDLTRSDADAKYNVFNYNTVKDVLAIFPDIPSRSYTNPYGKNGGSIFVDDGWTWLVNNWNETTRLTPYTGFSTTRLPHQNTINNFQTYGINNPFEFNGFGTWCSSQSGAYAHGFNISGTNSGSYIGPNMRWGFLFNNETDFGTNDALCGIGMGSGDYPTFSAGDWGGGIERSVRFELYGR